ncbi:hypothetical protein SAMN05216350_106151 [Polaromonas sp. YR568]|nr:hypothetical protein SAMN05216350_106151 [Polaromonas sp. YR568]
MAKRSRNAAVIRRVVSLEAFFRSSQKPGLQLQIALNMQLKDFLLA